MIQFSDKLYCYAIGPIDDWPGAQDSRMVLSGAVERFLGSTETETFFQTTTPDCWHGMAEFCKKMAVIQDVAVWAFRELGWEGDVVDGPFYFVLPDERVLSFGYMLKQSNNGACFVASPHALPHLDGLSFGFLEVDALDALDALRQPKDGK